MPLYPITVRRCQHIKVNGIQCGSPALRNHNHCYFHHQWRALNPQPKPTDGNHPAFTLPNLEDANSIQLALAQVMHLLLTQQIEHRTASLLLRALRIAATNVKFTTLEPLPQTQIVIDPQCVEHRPLESTAWSSIEGQDYDIIEPGENELGFSHVPSREFTMEDLAEESRRLEESIARRIEKRRREDPDFPRSFRPTPDKAKSAHA